MSAARRCKRGLAGKLVLLLLSAMVVAVLGPVLDHVSARRPATEASTFSNKVYLPFLRKDYPPTFTQPPVPFGVTMYETIEGPGSLSNVRMKEAGVKWVETFIYWSQLEPGNTSPENYLWSTYDTVLENAALNGFTVIALLGWSPDWASTYMNGPVDKVDAQEQVEFWRALVNRYKDPPYNVKYWEFYPEPDNTDPGRARRGWGLWGNNPAAYASMLRLAYETFKAVDPSAKIVFGGPAYDYFSDECDAQGRCGPFYRYFLRDVLEAGGGPYFDVMPIHYYPAFSYRWGDVRGKVNSVRDTLARYGLTKTLMVNEVGMWSDAVGTPQGSLEEQSRFLVKVFVQALSVGVEAVFWHSVLGGTGTESHGLLNGDLSPKPAFYAYKTLASQLGGYRYEAGMSTPAEVEGHVFTEVGGSKKRYVAWATGATARLVSIPLPAVRITDMYGAQSTARDGYPSDGDGEVNGRVAIQVTSNPVYVEIE